MVRKQTRPQSMLRITADDYEQAQRSRIAKGEQIRAIVQGRDQQDASYLKNLGFVTITKDGKTVKTAETQLLDAILRGDTDEPHPYLAAAYRRDHAKERAAFAEMEPQLEDHPAFSWMFAVVGIGPTLCAKLLSRLDIDLARNASSFWSYCGLSTVPGQRWHCDECGYTGIHPAAHDITGKHARCTTLAVKTHGPDDGIRAAQPGAERGQKRTYDSYAKKTAFLAVMQFLKAGKASYYESVYRAKRAYYDRERSGWSEGRRHYSAIRVTAKLFLSHLYEAWSIALGREPGECYAAARLQHDGIVSAQDVLEWEARAKQAA